MKTLFGQNAREIPLNCLDRYMTGQENEFFHTNCHLTLDLDTPVEVERLQKAISQLFEEFPICRSVIVETKKKFHRLALERPWFEPKKFLEIHDRVDAEKEDEFIQRPFRLDVDPPIRFLYLPTAEGKWRLYFSAHHSSFDGVGLGILFQEFFLAWEGKELSQELKTYHSFRYRQLFLRKGVVWFSKIVFKFVRPFGRTKRRVNATLLADPGNPRREVSVRLVDFQGEELRTLRKNMARRLKTDHVKLVEYFTFCAFRVLDRMISDFGDREKPITFILPFNQRSTFRFRKIFQNIVGMMWVTFERNEIQKIGFFDAIRRQLEEKSRLEETSRLPFYFGFFSTILSPAKLREALKKSDEDPRCVFNTLLIRAGRLPGTFQFPKEFRIHRLYGQSGLPKTPGMCLTLTGPRDRQTLSIEWLRHLIPEERIIRFEQELLRELWSETQDA
jgi:hypothetical protein